jgi:hypothetical protein
VRAMPVRRSTAAIPGSRGETRLLSELGVDGGVPSFLEPSHKFCVAFRKEVTIDGVEHAPVLPTHPLDNPELRPSRVDQPRDVGVAEIMKCQRQKIGAHHSGIPVARLEVAVRQIPPTRLGNTRLASRCAATWNFRTSTSWRNLTVFPSPRQSAELESQLMPKAIEGRSWDGDR